MLTEKTNEVIEKVNELKEIVMKEIDFDMLEDMGETGMIAMAKAVKLMNLSMDLAREQAEVMDEINAKLDKLLAMKEKGSI